MATDLERLVVSLEANIKKFEKEMSRSRQVTDTAMRGVEKRTEQATQRIQRIMSGVGNSIKAGLAGALAGVSVQQIAKFADGYTKIQNALKVTGLEGAKLASTYQQLLAISQQSGASLDAMAQLYSRMAASQKELNATTPQMLELTKAVGLALQVQGSSTEQASGALLQLGQALGSGKVQWEEIEGVMDGARPLLQAAAAGMEEAGGSVSKLTGLIRDGKVSSEAFFRAILAGMPLLEERAGSAASTMEQGWQRVENAMTDLVGKLGEATGASENAAAAINGVGGAIESIAGYVPGAIAALGALQAKLTEIGNSSVWRAIYNGFDAVGMAGMNGVVDVDKSMSGRAIDPDRTSRPAESTPLALRIKPIRNSSYAVPGGSGKKGGGGGGGKKGGGGGGKSDAEKSADEVKREIESLQERRRETEAEVAALGKNNAEKQTAITLAKLKIDANSTEAQTIRENVTAIDEAKAAIDRYEQAQQDAQEAIKEFGSTLADAFKDAVLEGESLDEVGRKLLKTFAAKGIDSVFNSLFDSKGGGLLGSLLGLGGKGVTSNPTGRAGGGPVVPGRAYTVGESGREQFVPMSPGRIVPMRKGGGGSVTHAPTYHITPAQGVSPEQLAAVIDRNNKQFARNLPQILGKSQARYS